jgi:hypothetical protein
VQLANARARAARQGIVTAQLVEDRRADRHVRECAERGATHRLIGARGVQQTERSHRDQIVAIEPGGDRDRQPTDDTGDEIEGA